MYIQTNTYLPKMHIKDIKMASEVKLNSSSVYMPSLDCRLQFKALEYFADVQKWL